MAFALPYDTPASHKIIALPNGATAPLVGKYKLDDGRIVNIEQGRRFLEASIKGEYVAGLLPESARTFYMPLGEGTFRFSGEPEQAMTLTMHYDGSDLIAHRIQ
jgi:hypothetical protein